MISGDTCGRKSSAQFRAALNSLRTADTASRSAVKAFLRRVTDAPKPHMEFEVAEIRAEDPKGPAIPCGVINIQPGARAEARRAQAFKRSKENSALDEQARIPTPLEAENLFLRKQRKAENPESCVWLTSRDSNLFHFRLMQPTGEKNNDVPRRAPSGNTFSLW